MSEKLRYVPIREQSDLKESGVNAVGCVVAVVNREGQVYVVDEVEKGIGRNLLTETRKEGEFIMDNVRGALVEEMGVKTEDFRDFWYVPGVSYLGRVPFPKQGLNVQADVVLVAYTGTKNLFSSRNEVKGEGFMNLGQLQVDSKLREETLPALELINQSGAIPQLFQSLDEVSLEVFNGHTAEQYYNERLQKHDLVAK